jgi:4-amino-4-deoxy-L-arabinose transferase-like glycosyltransferase
MTTRTALWTMIVLPAGLRLAWAATLGAYTNEAYYYLYARHLDWGFFDHPPMVGAVAAVGLKAVPGVPPVVAMRVGFVALFAGSTWLMARLTARHFGPRAGVLAALALNATAFYGLAAGTLAGPDGPLLFFWLLALDRLSVAFDDPDRTATWVAAGLAWGAALLSKYHAALLPAGAVLYLLLNAPARRCLRAPGPYLAAAAGLLVFAPVIAWNAAHGWASFAFQGTRAGGFEGVRPEKLAAALLGEALYLTPWVGAALVAVLARLVRRGPRHWSGPEAFLACQAAPALALFHGVATFRGIMPHWPLIGFVALMPLLGRAWSERLAARPVRFARGLAVMAAAPVVFAILFVAHARTGLFQDGRGRLLGLVPPRSDPSVDTIRWGQIARELARRGLLDDPGTFLFTDYWRFSAELELATRRAAPVACFHRDARGFTFWSRPEDWVGRDGIFVRVEDGLAGPEDYAPWFRRVEPIAAFPVVRGGVALQTVRLYRCVRQTDPYLFGYAGRDPVPRPGDTTVPVPRGGSPSLGARPATRSLH